LQSGFQATIKDLHHAGTLVGTNRDPGRLSASKQFERFYKYGISEGIGPEGAPSSDPYNIEPHETNAALAMRCLHFALQYRQSFYNPKKKEMQEIEALLPTEYCYMERPATCNRCRECCGGKVII